MTIARPMLLETGIGILTAAGKTMAIKIATHFSSKQINNFKGNRILELLVVKCEQSTSELNQEDVNMAEVNTSKVNTAEVNTSKVNTAEVNTSKVNTAEVNTSKVNIAEVDAVCYTWTCYVNAPLPYRQPHNINIIKPPLYFHSPSNTNKRDFINCSEAELSTGIAILQELVN